MATEGNDYEMYGAEDPDVVLQRYYRRQMMVAMVGPFVSLVVHAVALVAMIVLVRPEPRQDSFTVEVTMEELPINEVEPPLLEEIEDTQEEINMDLPAPDMPEAPVPEPQEADSFEELDTDIAGDAEDMEMTEFLDVQVSSSPLTVQLGGMLGGRSAGVGGGGGSTAPPETREMVRKGLAWLAAKQNAGGNWPKDAHVNAVHAAATLAFLGQGHSTQRGRYKDVVRKSIYNFIGRIGSNGGLGNHGHATPFVVMAVCDAYAMEPQDAKLAAGARRMVDYVLRTQHLDGGWSGGARTTPKDHKSIGVAQTVWYVMALFSARLGGMEVPEEALEKARDVLLAVAEGRYDGKIHFTNHGGRTAAYDKDYAVKSMLFTGLHFLGVSRDNRVMQRLAQEINQRQPPPGQRNYWLVYNQGMGMFQMGRQHPAWREFDAEVLREIARRAEPKGEDMVAWTDKDHYRNELNTRSDTGANLRYWGDCGNTAMALLNLEVYYRYGDVHRMYQRFGRIVPESEQVGDGTHVADGGGNDSGVGEYTFDDLGLSIE